MRRTDEMSFCGFFFIFYMFVCYDRFYSVLCVPVYPTLMEAFVETGNHTNDSIKMFYHTMSVSVSARQKPLTYAHGRLLIDVVE